MRPPLDTPMFPHDTLTAIAVFLPAVIPAIWWGIETRRLLARTGDPLLPERLLAARRRASIGLMFCVGVIAGVMARALVWAVPFVLLSRAAAGFALRRRLYEETWPFAVMVSFSVRLIAAVYGFYVAVAAMPWIIGAVPGARAWIASAAIAVCLIVWYHWHTSIFRALLGVQAVRDATLADAFAALAERAGVSQPRFEYVNMRGGSITNAIALPSLRGSSVVFTSTLLERLQTDEIIAIAAHEIAHLEYYSPKRLRTYRLAEYAFISAGGILLPVLLRSTTVGTVCAIWVVAGGVALAWRARHRQRNESDSDRRAVELTGTPDALARGLAKLHTFARLPRRYDAALERRATHPSLARRIRDIRAAAGQPADALDSSAAFADAATGTRVTFGATALEWARDGAEHHLSYTALAELRVAARRGGCATLIAADREGHRWEMPLNPADVGRAQTVLDGVDGQLAGVGLAGSTSRGVRFATLAIAAVAAAAGQFGCAFVALLTARVATMRMLAASTVACAAAAALAFRDGRVYEPVELMVCCAALLALTIARRHGDGDPKERAAIAAMAVAAALGLVIVLGGGMSTFRLHQTARAWPAACVLLVATAAAIRVAARQWIARYATIILAAAGLALGFAGSSAFVDGVVGDPLLVRAPEIRPSAISGAPAAVLPVSFYPAEVTLSPRGDGIMLWRDEDDDGNRADDWTLQIGRIGGAFTKVLADDAVFTPEGRVLSVQFTGNGAALEEFVPGTDPLWRTRIEGMVAGRLTLSADGVHWVLLGWDRRQQPVRAEGIRGAGVPEIVRWPAVPGVRYTDVAALGSAAAVVEKHYWRSALPALAQWAVPLPPYRTSARIWRLEPPQAAAVLADSQLDVTCASGAANGQLVCAAFDGIRTRIAAIPVSSGRILPLAVMAGRFTAYAQHASPGWLTGWRDNSAIAIRLDTLTAFENARSGRAFVRSISAAADRLAIVEQTDDGSAVAIYSVSPTAAAAPRK